jgi:hypothetical protein
MRIALPVIHATSDGAVGSFIAKLFAAKVRFSGSPLSDIRPDTITAAPRRRDLRPQLRTQRSRNARKAGAALSARVAKYARPQGLNLGARRRTCSASPDAETESSSRPRPPPAMPPTPPTDSKPRRSLSPRLFYGFDVASSSIPQSTFDYLASL